MKKWILAASTFSFASPALAETLPAASKQTGSSFHVPGAYVLILGIVALLAAVVVVSRMRAKLKTAVFQSAASNYIRPDSFQLHLKQDCFLYQTVQRRQIEQKKN